MAVTSHFIELTKLSSKTLDPEKVKLQLTNIQDRLLGSNRKARGWSVKLAPLWDTPVTDTNSSITYTATLYINCKPKRVRSSESIQEEFEKIIKVVAKAANAPGWVITDVDGDKEAAKQHNPSAEVTYCEVEIPTDWKKQFTHIYGRNEQIDLVVSAVQAGVRSNWSHRFHTVLIGPPAGGKTEICRSLVNTIGKDACLQYDATATTQAGAIEDLRLRAELPRLLVIEEIEKTDEASLRWLLGVLDDRAEIRKTTFRQDIKKECRMLGVATVNDYDLFKKLMDGALASRFCNPIYCPPPDRAILARILEREVDLVKGSREWIKPVLDFAEDNDISDPRRLKSICLCGRDELLNNSYQKKLKKCLLPED